MCSATAAARLARVGLDFASRIANVNRVTRSGGLAGPAVVPEV